MDVLEGMRTLALPDAILCSGAIYNTVWNVLTGRPPLNGIKDADVGYFDAGDLGFEAEDCVIQRASLVFARSAVPVELRNQARVHLWAREKLGIDYPQLSCSADMLRNFATRTHAVALRPRPEGSFDVEAPFGLDDLFAFRLTPNPVLKNKATHEQKAQRAKAIWPELHVVDWPEA